MSTYYVVGNMAAEMKETQTVNSCSQFKWGRERSKLVRRLKALSHGINHF
jgi:hypothetical protein